MIVKPCYKNSLLHNLPVLGLIEYKCFNFGLHCVFKQLLNLFLYNWIYLRRKSRWVNIVVFAFGIFNRMLVKHIYKETASFELLPISCILTKRFYSKVLATNSYYMMETKI